MIRRLSLRTRLALSVSCVSLLGLTLVAVISVYQVGTSLKHELRESAEARLTTLLDQWDSGLVGLAGIQAGHDARFFYLDKAGARVNSLEFEQEVLQLPSVYFDEYELLQSLSQSDEKDGMASESPNYDPSQQDAIENLYSEEAALEELIELPLVYSFIINPGNQSQLFKPIAFGQNTLAIAVPVRLKDMDFQLGIAASLEPINKAREDISILFLYLVPLLSIAIAVATWFVVGRVLKPVENITRQVAAIRQLSVRERVPVPESNDEIAELAGTMNSMLERLQSSEEAQKRFISDASHELRSPVTATQLMLEVGLATPANTDWPANARALLSENERMASLVDNLLTVARISESSVGAFQRTVDLEELFLEESQRPSRVPVQIRVRHPARAPGSQGELERVARNLVDNATRHARSIVSIDIDARNGLAHVRVTDDGDGIPPHLLDHIFERFTRAEYSRNRAQGGAGLGLAIVHEVIAKHGGQITARNASEGGAIFEFSMNLATD